MSTNSVEIQHSIAQFLIHPHYNYSYDMELYITKLHLVVDSVVTNYFLSCGLWTMLLSKMYIYLRMPQEKMIMVNPST